MNRHRIVLRINTHSCDMVAFFVATAVYGLSGIIVSLQTLPTLTIE